MKYLKFLNESASNIDAYTEYKLLVKKINRVFSVLGISVTIKITTDSARTSFPLLTLDFDLHAVKYSILYIILYPSLEGINYPYTMKLNGTIKVDPLIDSERFETLEIIISDSSVNIINPITQNRINPTNASSAYEDIVNIVLQLFQSHFNDVVEQIVGSDYNIVKTDIKEYLIDYLTDNLNINEPIKINNKIGHIITC